MLELTIYFPLLGMPSLCLVFPSTSSPGEQLCPTTTNQVKIRLVYMLSEIERYLYIIRYKVLKLGLKGLCGDSRALGCQPVCAGHRPTYMLVVISFIKPALYHNCHHHITQNYQVYFLLLSLRSPPPHVARLSDRLTLPSLFTQNI